MFITILIFYIYNLIKMSININFCEHDNSGLNSCHDGGCNNPIFQSTDQMCLCSFSKNVMNGKYCGLYENKCLKNSCVNNGICKSGVGHHVCECPNNFYGVNCELSIKTSDVNNVIKKPSIYYRIKSKQGEELYLLLISETFGNTNYKININGVIQNFGFTLNDVKKKIMVSDIVNICLRELSSEEFVVNNCNGPDNEECQNMCYLIPQIYGYYNEVETALIGPYFNTKSMLRRENIYFDLNNNNRMGGKYYLEVQLFSTNTNTIEYIIPFIQFVVDDELSLCLPFIEYFSYPNQSVDLRAKEVFERSIMKINRNKPWTIELDLKEDSLCTLLQNNINEIKQWKIFKTDKSIQSYKKEKGVMYQNDSFVHEYSLFMDSYTLPIGTYIIYFELTLEDTKKNLKATNFYIRYIEILEEQLQGLIAKISEPSTIYLGNTFLTLDASESFNPNAKDNKKNLLYTWECNILSDENCKKITTKEPRRTLKNLLNKEKVYIFTLTLSVDNDYIKYFGKPQESIANITVYPDQKSNSKKKIYIDCIRNCKPLTSPSNNLHLKTKTNFIGSEFQWYYQKFNDQNMNSVDSIALSDVPRHILVVKKNVLLYETTYHFFVKYPKYELINNISITTITKPNVGNCTIQPQSGLAGKTLFTITCINFKNVYNAKNIFEYYQKNKNDEKTVGVLLKKGNGTMLDFKLTSSKHLTVKVINKYGAFVQINLIAQISECNINLLKNLYKELKFNIQNKDFSKAIAIIAIVSDVFHEHRISKFNMLFKALNQILIKNCIFCIDQFILILQKVIKDYYEVSEGKMKITELLIISKQLLRISESLCEYIKKDNDFEKNNEVDRIEQIKKAFQKNINILESNIKFNNNDKLYEPERYYWSSFDNMNEILQDVKNSLKLFGRFVIFDIKTYERAISCEDYNYSFIACILSSEWNKNIIVLPKSIQTLYANIGKNFTNELLSKGEQWGITIFNVKQISTQTSNELDGGIKIDFPIISLDISYFNKSNPNYLITNNKFKNYINLHFKNNDTIKTQKKQYTIQTPSQNNNNVELDNIILVLRFDMTNIGELFVTLSDLTYDLRFVWLRDKRPDNEIMNNDMYAIKLTANQKYEFTLKTLNKHKEEIHYIGISANMDNKIIPISANSIHFSMMIFNAQCFYWNGIKWVSDEIIVGSKTTLNCIHCRTNHLSLFSGSLLILPDMIDPIEEISHTKAIADNMVCLLVIALVFLVYIILLIWSKYQDEKDISRGEIIILHDNYPGEDEVYLVTVYTGHSSDAGTTANVCIQLHGNDNTSRVHWLYSSKCDILQRFNDDWFIIFTPKSLGELKFVHIWHDNYGKNPNWFCKRIEVVDVRKKIKWNFNVERWVSLLPTIDNIEHNVTVGNFQDWQKQAKDDVQLTVREEHLWASVFIRHPRALVTRCQRLSKILCLLLSVMLISLIFYDFMEDDEEDFLNFDITLTQISISVQSNILQALMTSSAFYCFTKSVKLKKYKEIHEPLEVQKANNEIKETWWKKLLAKFTDKKHYLPAQSEKNVKKSSRNLKINYWLITGWTLCILIYGLSSFLIIVYGLKLGHVKSLHWLMSIAISILQSVLLIEPLQILISSFVLFKFNQENINIISTYKIKLDNYRKNNKNRLQSLQLIQKIRESRRRYLYTPMTQKDAKLLQIKQKDKMWFLNFQENATTCLVLIFTSLCCISALYSFNSPTHIIHSNNINKLFLRNLFKKNTMDLETLKAFLTISLIDNFHIKEYYNGISILNRSMTYFNNERGWYNLYNSKLINGGIRLKQNRINEHNAKWEHDKDSYNTGWIKSTEIKNLTAWVYRIEPTIKYFGLWFPETENSGFILDLTGGRSEYKRNLNTHLQNGWLDNKTKDLVIEFQTYTPNVDCITMYKIKFQTTSGLLYRVNSMVWSVPSSSVLITWSTYVFTLIFMFMYTAMSIRLMSSLSVLISVEHKDGGYHRFWTTYECVLLAIVLCMTFAVTGRWQLMEVASKKYSIVKETAFVSSVENVCRAHKHVVTLASIIVAMALFRVIQLMTYTRHASHFERTLSASSGPVATIILYTLIVTFSGWYGVRHNDVNEFLNVFILGRYTFDHSIRYIVAVATFLFVNTAVVSVITKNYVVSKTY